MRAPLRSTTLLLVGLVLAGCSTPGSAASSRPSTSGSDPTADPGATRSIAPTHAPTAPPAIVGVWTGLHECERIMVIMVAAGMHEQGLSNIVDAGTLPGVHSVSEIKDPEQPCVGAVPVRHSHFFTAAGAFGSRDAVGNQVDDGTWRLQDGDTIVIGEVPFDFTMTGDALRLQPVAVGPCPTGTTEWCQEAWKLMVAMPGMEWRRQ